jgi:peptide/nickel transport system permease protein
VTGSIAGPEPFEIPPPPTVREQFGRHPPRAEMWVGVGVLVAYVAAALSAIAVFWGHLTRLTVNPVWIPPFNVPGMSWAHPFGVLPGIGTDLFGAVWQATPWDLSIVLCILAIGATLGFLLGAIAGLHEGRSLDSAVMFVGDSLGAIPAFFLIIVLFAGFKALAPGAAGIPLFIVLFGLILWPTYARTVRGAARTVAAEPFVESARASGAKDSRILFHHVMPNSLAPVLAQLPLDVAVIFFVLSVYPWFNCWVFPETNPYAQYLVPALPAFSPLPSVSFPEWGNLLAVGVCEGVTFVGGPNYWWMYTFPLLAIVLLGIGIGLFCDGLEKWLRVTQ